MVFFLLFLFEQDAAFSSLYVVIGTMSSPEIGFKRKVVSPPGGRREGKVRSPTGGSKAGSPQEGGDRR